MSENKEVGIGQNNVEVSNNSGFKSEVLKPELTDLGKNREPVVPREVRTWMQKLEEDPQINNQTQTNTNDDNGLQPIAPAVVKISLPTDRKTFTDGFAKPMDQAWRWLSEFVLRIVKQNQGRVKFKEE